MAAVVVVPVLEGHEGRCGKNDKIDAVGAEAGKDFLGIVELWKGAIRSRRR